MTEVLSAIWQSIWQQWAAAGVGFGLILVLRPLLKRRKIQPKPFDWKQFWYEVRWSAFTLTFTSVFGFIIQWGVKNGHTRLEEPASPGVVLLEFALYFVTFDAYFYFLHRAIHTRPLYWIHRIHHRSMSPEPLTAFSFHPLEGLLTGGFMLVAIFVFRVHGPSLIAIASFGVVSSVLVHSGYEPFPRWWYRSKLTGWFLTPMFHDRHHTKFVFNFGAFTTIWDRLFGTVAPGYAEEFERLGSEQTEPAALPRPVTEH